MKKSLVENAGLWKKTIAALMAICHTMVVTTFSGIVLFDSFLSGAPLFILHRLSIASDELYYKAVSVIINWTTPILVFGFPTIYSSGTKVYAHDTRILF